MQSDASHLALQDQLLTWFEQNKKQVLWGAVAVVLIGFAAGVYFWKQSQTQEDASENLSRIMGNAQLAGETGKPDDKLLKLAADYPGTEAAKRALILVAGDYFDTGKYKEAQAQFDHFLRDYRDSAFAVQALLGVAACKEAQGMTNEAVEAYKDIVDHHSSEGISLLARLSLGRLYQAQNKLELARDLYEQVGQSDPNGMLGSEAGMQLAELFSKNPSLAPARTPAPASAPALNLNKP